MHKELSNPLLNSLINTLRDNTLDPFVFRHTIKEITKILLYEAMSSQQLVTKEITTWNGNKSYMFVPEDKIVVVSVLRAGLSMHEAVIDTLKEAQSGFLGIKRDEVTHQSVLYYDRVEECTGKKVILVDPMVATGGSLCDAIKILREKNAAEIHTLNIIGSPEGVQRVMDEYPEIVMTIAKIDEKLNDEKFILPGLGDAGDRAYNTL